MFLHYWCVLLQSLTVESLGIQLTSDEKAKHAYFAQKYPTDGSISEKILDTLTPDDIRVLMKFEDEVCNRYFRGFH